MMSERTAFGDGEADVPKGAVELLHARGAIGIAGRAHLAQHERMAAHRTWPKMMRLRVRRLAPSTVIATGTPGSTPR